MQDMPKSVKIAVVQATPVLFDREKSMEKAARLIEDAGSRGAGLIVFPESFLPCYPRGISFGFRVGASDRGGREDYLRYYKNSLLLPDDLPPLRTAAKKAGAYVSIGVTERDAVSGTLYCSNVFLSPDGEYLGRHRKIKPTGSERCIWGEGDDFLTVKTPFGVVGSLICWENYMPLARTALYSQGVTVYLAPTADSRKEWQATVRHIAQEGRCFVISCNQFVRKSDYPPDLASLAELDTAIDEICPGGSCVIAPNGKYLCPPVYHREETLLCELPLDKIISYRADFDPCGHYSRPDLFSFAVKTR